MNILTNICIADLMVRQQCQILYEEYYLKYVELYLYNSGDKGKDKDKHRDKCNSLERQEWC